MSTKTSKGQCVLAILVMALINFAVDLCFLKWMAGWLIFDVLFYASIVGAVLFGREKRDEPAARDEKFPPLGYTGPFWNKPSATFLKANAQPFSPKQEIFVCFALVLPFVVLAYLLLRH